ncbi:zinc ribbon domain-containing protein [Halorubrum rubrum]|uniref:Zinc ribbon domain-containing protein n=1 Tax=Halorubrum rubrum TaxID=1126240 RepID=A0ABD5R2U0_9EURY|nr:zinc ribbon domain-containing protein [Halorubrum rubrum]
MPSDDDTSYSVFGDDSTDDEPPQTGSADTDSTDDGPGPGRAEYDEGTRAWNESRADPDPETLGSDGDPGCPKCGSEATETDEIATSGTGLTKLFDVQNRRFVVVSCANCGYSELYKGQSKGNAIDFFVG